MNTFTNYIPRPNWLEINLTTITNNIHYLRHCIGQECLLMAVIKANAYGHGATRIAQTALDAGADYLAVATLSEALELRSSNVQAPILVLGYTPLCHVLDANRAGVTLTVYDLELVQALEDAAGQSGQRASVHIKVNTGMNRLGIRPQDTPKFVNELRRFTNVDVEGIFTHFATADEADLTFALKQFAQFTALLQKLEDADLRPPLAHAANSAATLALPQTHLQMVRPGIAIYGLHPDPETARLPTGFRPALRWVTQVAQKQFLQPKESVSYGREFVASKPMTLAVLPVGYADGFPRKPHNWGEVLIAGQRAPILGRVCMDQTIVDITAIEMGAHKVHQGDEVVLIGRQGSAELSADDAAKQTCTNNYDVVSRILSRVPRMYVS